MAVDHWVAELTGRGEFIVHAVARTFLEEFGGLDIGARGPGRSKARMTIQVDPLLTMGEADRFEIFERQLGSRLAPLGEVDDGHAFLAMDERGATYVVMDDAFRVGDSPDEALIRMVEGIKYGDPL